MLRRRGRTVTEAPVAAPAQAPALGDMREAGKGFVGRPQRQAAGRSALPIGAGMPHMRAVARGGGVPPAEA